MPKIFSCCAPVGRCGLRLSAAHVDIMRVVLLIVLTLIIEVVTFVNEKWFRPFKAWRDKYPEDDRIPLPISIEAYMTTVRVKLALPATSLLLESTQGLEYT